MDDNYWMLFLSCKFPLSTGTKLLKAQSQWQTSVRLQSERGVPREKTPNLLYGAAACTWGRISLAARLKKTNECSQTKRMVPYRLVHPPSHLPQSRRLPSCHFITVNSRPPRGNAGGTSKHIGHFFFPSFSDAEEKEQLSLLTLSDEQCPDVAMVMYLPPSCMWHIEMIGITAGNDGFCTAAGAYVQRLNCRAGIHLKVGLKVKLKGCGAPLSQGYVHINSFPKVLSFKLCQMASSTMAELKCKIIIQNRRQRVFAANEGTISSFCKSR